MKNFSEIMMKEFDRIIEEAEREYDEMVMKHGEQFVFDEFAKHDLGEYNGPQMKVA